MAEDEAASIVIEIEQSATAATVVVRGEIDLESSAALVDAFASLGQPEAVHLDLGDVEYMDSTGLRAVLAARAELEARGARLDVVRASSIVARLFEITGLRDMVSEPPLGDTTPTD
jgi:anti-anti-sigma factor